jgi:hypothetical protein
MDDGTTECAFRVRASEECLSNEAQRGRVVNDVGFVASNRAARSSA